MSKIIIVDMSQLKIVDLGKVLKKYIKKWLDLSNVHLTPASQAERWIKKILIAQKAVKAQIIVNILEKNVA